MCGITGIVSFERSEFNLLQLMVKMNHRIRHRGPDDEGIVLFENDSYVVIGTDDTAKDAWELKLPYLPQYKITDSLSFAQSPNVVLGHRRLSIINLSPAGHQPMCDSTGRYWIVFNGAIYNYEELRTELLKLGHHFFSCTDTEVLLHSYIEWGMACVNKFIGMWAFVIYDKLEQKIIGSRDRIGVKPFYYTYNQNYFSFASEIKALRTLPFISQKLNDVAIYDYLILGRIENEEESIIKDVFELQPGNIIEVKIASKSLKKHNYCSSFYNGNWEKYNDKSNDDFLSELTDLLEESIKLHLRTDVTVGACLSGGLDSSIISALVSNKIPNLPVFTVTSKGDKEDESQWAKLVVDKFNLKWYTTNPGAQDFFANIEELTDCQDIPIKGANTFTQFELMRLVNQYGVKVTIDGQGADELFAGYSQYYSAFLLDALKNGSLYTIFQALIKPSNDFAQKQLAWKIPLNMVGSKIVGTNLSSKLFKAQNPENDFINKDFWNSYSERISILQSKVKFGLNETLERDFHGNGLKTMLRVGDRNSMHFGIESRVPFADDYRLEEFALRLPAIYKVKNNFSKSLLREAGRKWLPQEICYRKDKKGFSVPEKRWMIDLGNNVLPYFEDELSPYLSIDNLKKDWINKLNQSASSARMWRMFSFAVWMKRIKQNL